jgi:uncharacterized protein
MAAGADGAADALVKRYAKRGAIGEPGVYRIRFTGLQSAEDYMRLSAYLQKLAVVRRIAPLRATPEALELELELVSGLPGFRRAVDDDGVIEALDPADPAGATGGFRSPTWTQALPCARSRPSCAACSGRWWRWR